MRSSQARLLSPLSHITCVPSADVSTDGLAGASMRFAMQKARTVDDISCERPAKTIDHSLLRPMLTPDEIRTDLFAGLVLDPAWPYVRVAET
jgi:hypothetical protein